jgi:hypothetical protein
MIKKLYFKIQYINLRFKQNKIKINLLPMRKITSFFMLLLVTLVISISTYAQDDKYLPSNTTNNIIHYNNFVLSFNLNLHDAEWVCYQLTEQELSKAADRSSCTFKQDYNVKGSSNPSDYTIGLIARFKSAGYYYIFVYEIGKLIIGELTNPASPNTHARLKRNKISCDLAILLTILGKILWLKNIMAAKSKNTFI